MIQTNFKQQYHDEQIELKRQRRVWNGRNPSPKRWKFMAALFKFVFRSESGSPMPRIHCSGVILNEYHILTAAHCVYNQSWQDFYILVGSHSLYESYQNLDNVRQIHSVKIHDKYLPTRNGFSPHDIAIIKLHKPFMFDRYISPVSMPNFSDPHSKFCYILGYGKEKSNDRRFARLRQLKLPMIEPHICERISRSKFNRNHQLCAGYVRYRDLDHWISPKIVSEGDSGGALMCRLKLQNITQSYVLIGLATGGKRPKRYKRVNSLFISYFAQIKFHLKWIRSHSKIESISLKNE